MSLHAGMHALDFGCNITFLLFLVLFMEVQKLLVTQCWWCLQVCQLSSNCSTSYSEACGRLHAEPEVPKSVTVSVSGPIDPYRFNMFMSDLLAERGSDIKQMHGILSIQVTAIVVTAKQSTLP